MTGKQEYLDACKLWSDRMIECQNAMIPKGAYYMQYGRRPGEDKGDWYVADCSSIALGVLATFVTQATVIEGYVVGVLVVVAGAGGLIWLETDARTKPQ